MMTSWPSTPRVAAREVSTWRQMASCCFAPLRRDREGTGDTQPEIWKLTEW